MDIRELSFWACEARRTEAETQIIAAQIACVPHMEQDDRSEVFDRLRRSSMTDEELARDRAEQEAKWKRNREAFAARFSRGEIA